MRRQLPLDGARLLVGGRSSGARVACRTADAVGAAGVLCLAFPLHPPGRPEKTRLPELEGVTVPVLIIQGESDPFGMPPEAPAREVVKLRGNHSLRSDVNGLRDAVRAFGTRWPRAGLDRGDDRDVDQPRAGRLGAGRGEHQLVQHPAQRARRERGRAVRDGR